MKNFADYITEQTLSKSDLDGVEKYADRLYAAAGIDVEFTRHFLDRVNDRRNKKQITVAELIRMFKQSYKKIEQKNRLIESLEDGHVFAEDIEDEVHEGS